MTEVVQQPVQTSDSGSGFLMGIILLILFLAFLFFYGLPMIRQASSPAQINVPDKVDVNVNQ